MTNQDTFNYFSEQFADIRILRYKVPGFDELPVAKKRLLYYLSQAALWGRDIIWDQNYKYNLAIRLILENIYKTYKGDRNKDDFKAFETFLKRIWFANGIHHHYSMDKMKPGFSQEFLSELVHQSDSDGFAPVFHTCKSAEEFLRTQFFDDTVAAKRVVLDDGKDIVLESANNFYENVTEAEAEAFYKNYKQPDTKRPVSSGLNSKLVKENGEIREKVWKVGGLYGEALSKIVYWLEKAAEVSENKTQESALIKLIRFFETGDLKQFDEYNINWLKDTSSTVDVINGFIEVYGDPLGRKGAFESVVSIIDKNATKRAKTVSENAEWFEQHSTTHPEYKKQKIEGVTGKAINVVMESGDSSPATPIGINLPNADWIRSEYGSKSVTLSNIVHAYDEVSKSSGVLEAFAFSEEEIQRAKKYGSKATALHVDLHEIVGHGSGKMREGIGEAGDTRKKYASTIEETRADLVALYFAIDPKLIELGLMDSEEVGKAEYDAFVRSALLTQLVRVEPGKNIEEAHMRNRYLIAQWILRKGAHQNVIGKKVKEGRTYFVIEDYELFREYVGILLREVQRIKSEGDYDAARKLVETYGVQIDREIHKEVLERWKRLKIAPYAGFINPELRPVMKDGELADVKIAYPNDFATQMLQYSKEYHSLTPIAE